MSHVNPLFKVISLGLGLKQVGSSQLGVTLLPFHFQSLDALLNTNFNKGVSFKLKPYGLESSAYP